MALEDPIVQVMKFLVATALEGPVVGLTETLVLVLVVGKMRGLYWIGFQHTLELLVMTMVTLGNQGKLETLVCPVFLSLELPAIIIVVQGNKVDLDGFNLIHPVKLFSQESASVSRPISFCNC